MKIKVPIYHSIIVSHEMLSADFLFYFYFFKSAEELNKWLLSPNIPFRTSKSLCMVWLPVTSNHSHKSDVTV